MSFFKKPGEYDENSFWFKFLADRELRTEHHAVKTRQALENHLHDQAQTQRARRSADLEKFESIEDKMDAMVEYIMMLESRVMTLALYSRTTLQLMLDKGLVTHEEFTKRLQELDLEDGKLDGR